MERASIISNPVARKALSRQRLTNAAAAMKPRGWEVEVLESQAPMHARELAREAAAAGSSVVFAAGGDGTLNEVINGILGSAVSLGVIRAGTGNVFGKEVGVPRNVERALDVLVDGRDYRFDLGFAEGPGLAGLPGDTARRYFLLMAGIGFDGAVVRRVPSWPKRLLGTTSYVLWGGAEAFKFRSRPVCLEIDGERAEADLYWTLISNTRSYGGVADIARHAVADDGLLEVYTFAGGGLPWLVGMSARIALKRHDQAPGVSYRRAASVRVETPDLDVQADGEYFGRTPMSFGVASKALSVRLAPGAPDRLLASA